MTSENTSGNNQDQKQAPTGKSSRRDFLRQSSAVMAGGVVAGGLSIARAAHAYGSEEIRIGLVGAGGRGTGAAAQAMNTKGPVKLVAIGDAFKDHIDKRLEYLKKQYGQKVDVPPERQFAGLDAFKKVLEQDIDLVILATPPGFRPQHFEAAIKANKHVFMEKPVAVDAPGVRRVLAANEIAKKQGNAVAVGLQRRHEPRYKDFIKRIKDGAIGDVILGRAYWNGGGVWDPRKTRDQVSGEMEYQLRNWYYYNWLCGDHIAEQHIHNLDVINWIKDAYPVSAQGQGGREVRTAKKYGQIFDHHFVEFTYADGSKMLSQCRHIRRCWGAISEHAHGTKGSADIDGRRGEILDANGTTLWKVGREGGGGHQVEHHNLFADLRAGKIPNEGDYGAKSTMTAILGRMCTYSGQMISWEEALKSDNLIAPTDKYTSFSDTPPVVPDAKGYYPVPVPGVTDVL